jgi:hypothetical protein
MHKRAGTLAMAAALALVVAACGDDDETTSPQTNLVTYKATLSGAAERPTPVTSPGTGSFTGTYNPTTGLLSYTVTFTGLGAPSSLSHIHGPGTVDQAVGVLVNFQTVGNVLFIPGPTAETYNGTISLTAANAITTTVSGDSLRKLMDAGLTYVNVHSTTYPGGEIRGQITKQ